MQADRVLCLCEALSVCRGLISILDSSADGESRSVLAEQHMACLCLDASCKQGLMSLLVELRPGRVVGRSQTSQQ